MPTLNTYFAQVFRAEEELKAAVRQQLPGAISVDELLLDANGVGGALVQLMLDFALPTYERLEAVGFAFAQEVNGAPVQQPRGTAVAEGLRKLHEAATATVGKFLIDFTRLSAGMLDSGMEPDAVRQALQVQLANPLALGPVFSSLVQGLAAAAASGVQVVGNQAMLASLTATPGAPDIDDAVWVWLTVHDSRVCPDCGKRHNVKRTLAEWVALGEPRSGWSVCGDRCRCVIMPDKYVDDEIDLTVPITMSRDAVLATITRRT